MRSHVGESRRGVIRRCSGFFGGMKSWSLQSGSGVWRGGSLLLAEFSITRPAASVERNTAAHENRLLR